MSLDIGEAEALIGWTARTSAIYQTEEPDENQWAYLEEQFAQNLTCSESTKKIAQYVIDVLTNYDSKLLEEGPTKKVIDAAIMVGNLAGEFNNISNCKITEIYPRKIHIEEVQNLNEKMQGLQDEIPSDSEWSSSVAILAETTKDYLAQFELYMEEDLTDSASITPDSKSSPNMLRSSSSGSIHSEEFFDAGS